jgi:hypothetical protein
VRLKVLTAVVIGVIAPCSLVETYCLHLEGRGYFYPKDGTDMFPSKYLYLRSGNVFYLEDGGTMSIFK